MNIKTAGDWVKRHRIILLFSAILAVAIFLRFYHLGTESIWLDESQSIKESAMSVQDMVNHSNQPPLYFLILRAWIYLFGAGEVAIRSLSAVFGVAAVALVFMVGRSLVNARVGLISAFIASFAAFTIQYSQDARAYSLLLMLSLLSYWFFIELLNKNNNKWSLAYILAALGVVYTHFYGLFIIASQIVFLLIFFKKYQVRKWRYLSIFGIILLALVPFVLLLKNNISVIASNGFWIPKPGIMTLINTLRNFSGISAGRYELLGIFLALAILGLFVVFKLKSQSSQRKSKIQKTSPGWKIRWESPESIVLLVLWLGLSLLIPFIESQMMTPIYLSKYAIGAYPALCLLAAKGLDNLKWPWLFYPVLALIVALSSWGLTNYYKYASKEQWRDVAQLVDANAKPGDVMVFCEPYYQDPFNYYFRGYLEQTGINNLDEAKKFVDSEGKTLIDQKVRIWLVLAYSKDNIMNYFVNTYGVDSVISGDKYLSITVILFDLAGVKK